VVYSTGVRWRYLTVLYIRVSRQMGNFICTSLMTNGYISIGGIFFGLIGLGFPFFT
jgi:hypothetical protein